jgi:hypothetical protein
MVFQALKNVFNKPSYIIFAVVISMLVFVFATWLPNIRLISEVVFSPSTSISEKLDLPISLIGSVETNFTPLSASYSVAIAVLFGVDLAMIVFYLRRKVDEVKHASIATGFIGIASGVLGMGCAACGSFILTSMLSLSTASGIIAFLPLGGSEFGILGVILLLVSVVTTSKKIMNPQVCTIE